MRSTQEASGKSGLARRVTLVLTAGLLLLIIAAFLLTLIETNGWWVRYFDFMRVQVSAALLVLEAAVILLGGLRQG